VLALLCTACAKQGGWLKHAVGGTVAVAQADGRCDDRGVSKGTRVTISGSEGKLLGVTHLGAAQPDEGRHRCVYRFAFTGIPSSDRYSLSVAGRTSIYTQADLQLKNWFVNLTG